MALKMPPTSAIIKDLGLNTNGEVESYFTKRCADYMDKYVPFDKGNLADYRIDGHLIIYNQLYAQYQYYGLSKYGIPLHYSTDKHPNASSYWDRKMVTNHLDDIVDEIQKKFF